MDDSALLCVNTPYQRKDTVFPSVLHLVDNTEQSSRFSVWTVRSLDLFFLGVLPLLSFPRNLKVPTDTKTFVIPIAAE